MNCDKMLLYDWALDRWTLVSGGGFGSMQFVASLATPSITLEGVDAPYGRGVPISITSYTTTTGIFTADQPGTFETSGAAPLTLTAGVGVQITTTSTSVTLASLGFTAGVPYYITA